jgi:PadR family transcriptional regulator, regulatory protein PadR
MYVATVCTHTSNVDGRPMSKRPLDLLQGTLDVLILKTLSWGPAHGYVIARWIGQLSAALLTVGEGSLYPALHRLQERGWVESEWKISDNNRRAKFYRLTPRGRRQLRAETETWTDFAAAVGRVLAATERPE